MNIHNDGAKCLSAEGDGTSSDSILTSDDDDCPRMSISFSGDHPLSDNERKTGLGAVPKKKQQVKKEYIAFGYPILPNPKFSKSVKKFEAIPVCKLGLKVTKPHGWDRHILPKTFTCCERLLQLNERHERTDVDIVIGKWIFHCHLLVLQAHSAFFRNYRLDSKSEPAVIKLPEDQVSASVFTMIYNWTSAPNPMLQPDCILELFKAAIFLEVEDMINQCWFYFDLGQLFNEDIAFLNYQETKKYQLDLLGTLMLDRVNTFFLTLVASKDFLELTTKEVCYLLQLNTIGVNTEVEILMAAVRWLSYDWENRQSSMMDIMKCVRFCLMPAYFLLEACMPQQSIEFNRIVENPDVEKMILKGLFYVTTEKQICKTRLSEQFENSRGQTKFTLTMERKWIYDPNCSYHHGLECKTSHFLTYDMFLKYLKQLRNGGKQWKSVVEIASRVNPINCCKEEKEVFATD